MRYLPKWLRQLIALALEFTHPEYGGILYDFTAHLNGDLEEIHRWDDDAGVNQAIALIDNAHESGRDFVYVSVCKSGQGTGYFAVHSSCTYWWLHAFNQKWYDPLTAYRETMAKAEADARKLGFNVDNALKRGLVSE